MPISRTAVSFILIALLSACGSGPRYIPPAADERLIPEITADGTKFFVLQRDYLRPEMGDPGAANRSRPQQDNGLTLGERDIERRLSMIMERTGYCREGFFELYREQTLRSFSVRGECREDATDEDRQRFSSGAIRW